MAIGETIDCNDAKQIFLAAESFAFTSRLINKMLLEQSNQISALSGNMGISSVTNMAFSIELYLKCLSCIENKTFFYRGHSLKALFEKLKPENRKIIIQYHDEFAKENNTVLDFIRQVADENVYNFMYLIDISADAFTEFRYSFESNKADKFYLINVFKAIRKRILELHPEWPDLLPK